MLDFFDPCGAPGRGAALLVIASIALWSLSPTIACADDEAEATVLFASGNEHFQRAMRLRGERRTRELEAALDQYVQSLERVRSRNVLYNAALVLEALDRPREAFNHWTEYLQVEGLTEAELTDGRQHREALRPRVAVFEIRATATAEVWVDRRDLGSRGRTPLEIALPEGEHTFYLAAAGHRETRATATGALGQVSRVSVELEVLPVWVQVLAPEGSVLEIDGGRVTPGQSVPLPPGPHLARVSVADRVLAERRFEAMVGAAPLVIDMTSALGAGGAPGVLDVTVSTAARVEVDGVVVGEGEAVRAMVPPGPHQLRVSAGGYEPWVGSQDLTTFPATLSVSLTRRASTGILVARGILGGLTLVGAGVGIWALVNANDARLTNERLGNPVSASGLENATAAVDILWSITGVLGGLSVLFLVLDPGGGESSATFSVEPAPGGATLSLRGSFGGVL